MSREELPVRMAMGTTNNITSWLGYFRFADATKQSVDLAKPNATIDARSAEI